VNQGYATGGPEHARRLLENLVRKLAAEHPGAAVSLREGLDETLTVMRLGLPASLERVLSSTNLIENLFSRVRDVGRGVKLWQGGNHGAEMDYGGVCSKLSAERPVDALSCRVHPAF
jgi:putative transposase